jgi:hypothetical protein
MDAPTEVLTKACFKTDEKRHLFLKDIVELPVGHAPRGLAGCFRTIMDKGG